MQAPHTKKELLQKALADLCEEAEKELKDAPSLDDPVPEYLVRRLRMLEDIANRT